MKYTFETDDEKEARLLFNALDAFSALTEIAAIARNQLKHGEEHNATVTLERVRSVACETLGAIE
jgi:hypothetical protein